MAEAPPAKPRRDDGRARRARRSREAIANALFELVGEGHVRPTAQQVAERAAVGIRTVFRHFDDMESLYATLDARLVTEVRPILEAPRPEGRPDERAEALVRRRAAFFERIAPYKRAADRVRAESAFVSRQQRRLVELLREDLLRALPEAATAPDAVREALDQAASFEAWDRLRSEQGLGRGRAAAAMTRAVRALLAGLDGAAGSRGGPAAPRP